MRYNMNKMKFADKAAFSALSGLMSYDQAADAYRQGRMGDKDWRAFVLAWEWCSFRFSSSKQDRYYNKMGRDAFYRRIERARKLVEAYKANRFAYCAED